MPAAFALPLAARVCFYFRVVGNRIFLKYWLPALVWMLVIFSASTDVMSSRHTSRFLAPLLRWLLPGAAEATVGELQFAIRKTGHLTEYAVLAWLLWRARRQPVKNDPRPWNWREAAWAAVAAGLYAMTDEFHQSYYASRHGTPWDVLLDTAGAVLGLLALWLCGRWRNLW